MAAPENSYQNSVGISRGQRASVSELLSRAQALVPGLGQNKPAISFPANPVPPSSSFPFTLSPASNPATDLFSSRNTILTSWVPGTRQKGVRLTKGETVSQSRFRPSVLASKRVLLWSSAFYERLMGTMGSASRLHVKVELAVLAGLEESTLTQYGVGLKRFAEFCDQEQVPEEERVPASEFLLCAFASVMALEVVQRSTLNTWLAGLRAWHLSQGAPWNLASSDRMDMIKKAVSKRAPTSSKKARRPPVTTAHLRALAKHMNLLNSFDIAVFAATCTAFWSCMRLGEILVDSGRFFDPARSPSKAMALVARESREGLPFLSFDIPWTKTTKNEGATVIVNPRNGDPTCPIRALHLHLHANSSSDPTIPFFAFSTTSKSTFETLTRAAFMARCNEVWEVENFGRLTGHSFRIGGTTELLLQGRPPEVVQKQGRWKSSAFLLYWRSVDEIIPTFLGNRVSESELATLRTNMSVWFTKSVQNS